VTSCLYDVIRAKSYPVGKEFPFSLSYDFLSEKTVLLECGEDELAICSSGDDGEGAEISSGRDTDVRITGSPPSGSVIGGPHSGARDSAQDDADGFGHGGSTARLARRPLPPGRKAALAGRKRSRGGGDAGVGEESAPVDAVSASTQQVSEHLARSEAQRAERNETSRRRVVLFERELEVRKFELLLGPSSSATEQEKQTARALLLNSLNYT
jgi:hypothetical protein